MNDSDFNGLNFTNHMSAQESIFCISELRIIAAISGFSIIIYKIVSTANNRMLELMSDTISFRGARWLSGRVPDSGARGRGFETYRRRVVSLSKTLYSPKVLVNYPGSGGSVPT